MFVNLYHSAPVVSCFDDAADAAAKAASDAAAAAAAAGAGGANDPPKTFTQDDVNRILADDKRKHQITLAKTEQTYKDLLANNTSLSTKERSTLEENLVTVQGQLRTKEEQAKMEKKALEESMNTKIAEEQAKARGWETRYKDETVTRSLLDAAVADAYNPSQVVTILKGMTKLVEEVDESTGKATGKFKTVVEFPDVDAEGNPTITVRSPADTVKRMKELPEVYGNLFKSNVVSGIGANSTTGVTPGHNGKVNLKNLTPQQYRELRAKNPEALGLKPQKTSGHR